MILVTGGTGTVGSRVVQSLIDNRQEVRIFARGLSDWNENKMPYFRRLGVDVMTGDIRNEERLTAAVSGCQGIIHLAGVIKGTAADDVLSVNVDALGGLLKIAEAQSIQRFVHISCLGATRFSNSKYLASKWRGEELVKKSNFYWTVFRPALIFGTTSTFLRALDFWASSSPIIPVVGGGLNRIAPVAADDVAACIVQSLYKKETVNQTYDLVGPQSYSLTELLEIAAGSSGKRKPLLKLPSKIGLVLAEIISLLNPNGPISADIMRTLCSEILADPAIMKQNFQVQMLPLETTYGLLPASKPSS